MLGLAAGPANSQTGGSSPVTVDQISKPRATVAPIPQPVASSSRAIPGSAGAEALATPRRGDGAPASQLVEICREAGLRGASPEGLNCAAILEEAATQAPRPTGEGALLQLFGQRANVTGPAPAEQGAADADAVARQLSSGAVQGASGSQAAGVVARQREAPPASRPR